MPVLITNLNFGILATIFIMFRYYEELGGSSRVVQVRMGHRPEDSLAFRDNLTSLTLGIKSHLYTLRKNFLKKVGGR
jgi:hypothetical protein